MLRLALAALCLMTAGGAVSAQTAPPKPDDIVVTGTRQVDLRDAT